MLYKFLTYQLSLVNISAFDLVFFFILEPNKHWDV